MSTNDTRFDSPFAGQRSTRRYGRFVVMVTTAAAVLMVTRCFVVEGYLIPTRVSGPSMAPSLLGEHHRIKCGECGFEFVVGPEPPRTSFVRCPNCATDEIQFPQRQPRTGDSVLIDKWSLVFRDPRRWETVVITGSDSIVKRVVGLPGETIQIVAGDVFVNGRVVPRTIDVLRQMQWIVNDDRHRRCHQGSAVSRWSPASSDSSWVMSKSGFETDWKANGQPSEVDWLMYRHVYTITGAGVAPTESVVFDDIPINQATQRSLNSVADLMLAGRCNASSDGQLIVRQNLGQEIVSWTFDFAGATVTLRSAAGLLASADFPQRRFRFLAGFCDGDAVLWVDDRLVLRHRLKIIEQQSGSPRPFRLGARGLNAMIDDLVVLRDTYFTTDSPRPVEASWRLDANEFFLLGDNSPVSLDSRHWPKAIGRDQLAGLALRW